MSEPRQIILTIDGKRVTVPEGTTVLQACEKVQSPVPFYCYHPGLSIAGNCRICLVEIEKNPKLQISCYTRCADGMVVHTNNEKVLKARQDVLEFLLVNHPLDCPVCDQAGECWLQDYYMNYGLYDQKFDEAKVKKQKAVPVGPNVMLDAERCILCSRCTRFVDEITHTGELGIFDRGDHAEIGVVPGKPVDNAYAGNVVDICPVGALTDRDFRFKCRVWYLGSTDSVCPGCAQGCNIQIHFNREQALRPHVAEGKRVMRLKPRYNPDVNQWWMCDEGRYGYRAIDDHRILRPQLRQADALGPASWNAALQNVATMLRRLRAQQRLDQCGVIASAQLTNEDLWMIHRVFRQGLGAQVTAAVPARPGTSDDFLRKADKHPNTRGAVELGMVPPPAVVPLRGTARSADRAVAEGDTVGGGMIPTNGGLTAAQLMDLARRDALRVLYIFGHDVVDLFGEAAVKEAASHVELIVFQGSNINRSCDWAHVILPSASYAEKDGTFTNWQGRVQRIRPAFPPLGDARVDWRIVRALGELVDVPVVPETPEAIFLELAWQVPTFRNIDYERVGTQGALLQAAAEAAV